ncbi:MAG: NAD(P)-dependent alcohol dehydrogenase [Oligoflexia bacterium]|nr:NAD(P)-dependent alcohol dehydrogenase [Oligoflexia bacterium]
MLPTKAFAAPGPTQPLGPFQFDRREPGPKDVLIDIRHCGVCHSDLHQARDEWGGSIFPMVPGHEIVGIVQRTGAEVKGFKPGDAVGVGCFVDSCRDCPSCREGLEQYCDAGMVGTYNSRERGHKTPTYGGYSTRIVVDERYVLRIPPNLPLDRAAPLLCAGITTYSPLRHWGAGPGKKVAVVGLGGLGHMGVKLAHAMGAHVTVLSHSQQKREDALRLGADDFQTTADPQLFERLAGSFDLILNTVSVELDLNEYLGLLKRDGAMVLLGVPTTAPHVHAFSLIMGRRSLSGSLIGGIRETQEMLDFCGKHNIASDIETIPIQDINNAYERMIQGDVRYRFVIDISSLKT